MQHDVSSFDMTRFHTTWQCFIEHNVASVNMTLLQSSWRIFIQRFNCYFSVVLVGFLSSISSNLSCFQWSKSEPEFMENKFYFNQASINFIEGTSWLKLCDTWIMWSLYFSVIFHPHSACIILGSSGKTIGRQSPGGSKCRGLQSSGHGDTPFYTFM